MNRIAWIAALLLVALPLQAKENFVAKNNYGAIAFNPGTGAWGYSFDQRSRRTALNAALTNCGLGCNQIRQFKDSCGAIAASRERPPKLYALATGDARELAEKAALSKCKGCEIVAWVCTR